MGQVWQSWGQVIIGSALALPLCAAIVWWLGGRGRRDGRRRGWRDPMAEVGLVAGTLPWLWMVMTPVSGSVPAPGSGSGSGSGEVRLVPLVDLYAVLHGPPATALVQVAGNLLVFAALGSFLPVRFAIGLPTVCAIACAGSIAIETAQWALDLGRVCSIDDVLLNTLGAVPAALLSLRWWRTRSGEPVTAAVYGR